MRILLIFCLSLLPVAVTWSETVNIGDTAPDFSLPDKDGNTLNYYTDSDKRASIVLFWASSCPYCATLMPHLEVVYRKYRSKGLRFYAVDAFEDGKLDPLEFFTNKAYTYTLLLNGDDVAKQYGVRRPPGVYVMDKDKKVIYKRPAGVNEIIVKQNIDLKLKQILGE